MSGHSKWAKIKRQKHANDAKRGALFTKLGKAIRIAAAEGGGDPELNFALRLAIDKAKESNMPKDNIKRAIKRGTGESGSGAIQKVIYEGVGPDGSAFIVKCSTDNTNRTVSEIRKIFETNGGSMGSAGSMTWKFEELGVIEIKSAKFEKAEKFGEEDKYVSVSKDDLELDLYDIEGIKDVKRATEEDDFDFEIITQKIDFAKVHKKVEDQKIQILTAELRFLPKNEKKVEDEVQEKVLGLMDKLDDHDDVDNVFTDVDLG
ncbi:YebC/PmpR family DNA-binding transcriptional regulator [Candidatus Dojkabacteria bacterium]|nr:YebC/PmpR family DNA-binding transcriptional regulator [Candidatus Dojkabacteria bacterium]